MTTEITALLKEWGVTIGLLAVAATALGTLLVLSLREFAFWFLRLNKILNNQKEVLARLETLEKTVKADSALLTELTTAEIPSTTMSQNTAIQNVAANSNLKNSTSKSDTKFPI